MAGPAMSYTDTAPRRAIAHRVHPRTSMAHALSSGSSSAFHAGAASGALTAGVARTTTGAAGATGATTTPGATGAATGSATGAAAAAAATRCTIIAANGTDGAWMRSALS